MEVPAEVTAELLTSAMLPPAPGNVANPVLSVRNLRTHFSTREGTVTAVRDVSFELNRAEKLAIVGESGSGKSALALSILGLIEPPGRVVGGDVWLNGRQISSFTDRQMQRVRGREISVIFQDPMTALNPVKAIGDQILEGIRMHQRELSRKAARQLVVDLLRDVEIPNAERRVNDYPHQYSGGMRQRVMIAIALANSPDVLIADEPTTALDVTTQAQVLELLGRLVSERKTAVILITHNLGVVAQFSDSVFVMYAGRFVERASTEQLFSRPVHPYSEALLASVPRPDRLQDGPLPSIPGFPPNLADLPAGCTFEPRCPVGHGRERCRRDTPAENTIVGDASVVAECHYARLRAAGEPIPLEEATVGTS